MTAFAKVELAAIAVLGVCFGLAAPLLPDRLSMGALSLTAVVLFLMQGLVRDLVLLARRRRVQHDSPERQVQCMCLESVLGVSGVVAGLALLGSGIGDPVTMHAWSWSLLAVAVTGIGFVLKDFVVAWRPWRIYRDPDHVNIVVVWKKANPK